MVLGRVMELKVDEVDAELALLTPYNYTARWAREIRKLRKPADGWRFADPTRYPIAQDDMAFGDHAAFERRRQKLLRQHEERKRLSELAHEADRRRRRSPLGRVFGKKHEGGKLDASHPISRRRRETQKHDK